MTTYFTTPSLYDPTDFLPWNYNDYYSIDLSLLTDIELDDPGLGIGDETGNEFPMEPFPFRNIPDYLSSIPEPHQQRVPTPVPSPLTPPPEPSSPHDTPISFQNTPAVSSPPLQSPHSQITEFRQEPSQDEGKENLSCSVGSSLLYETKVEGPMDFKDSGVACHQDDNEDEEQGESTDGKTGKKNEDSPETKKEEEVSKSDEELPRNDRPTRGCPSRYSFRDRGNNPLHRQSRPTVRKTVVLWKFIKELLDKNDSCVSWISREERTFKFVDSKQAAKLWGQRKNKRNMTYEKMSRALRYYYDRQIMYHEEGQKLMYRFGDGAREGREERVSTEEDREEFVANAS